MRAGMMRDRVTFKQERRVSDGQGGHTNEWEAVLTNEPCQLITKRGWETDEGDKPNNTARAILKMRYHTIAALMDTSYIAVIDGVDYQIRDIDNPDRRKRQLEIQLERGKVL